MAIFPSTPLPIVAASLVAVVTLSGAGLPNDREFNQTESDNFETVASESALREFSETSVADVNLDDLPNVEVDLDSDQPVLELDEISIDLPGSLNNDSSISVPDMDTSVIDNHGTAIGLEAETSPDVGTFKPGVRAAIAISNSKASNSYDFKIDLPAGHILELQEDGSVQGVDPSTGAQSVIIPEPWALDAAGQPLETNYEVSGSTLTQTIGFDETTDFPIVADPVWFVPLIIAGGRIIGRVAIRAATKAAAKRAAAARAAKTIVKTVSGKIPKRAAKRCGLGGLVGGGTAGAASMKVQKRGDGRWIVKVNNKTAIVASAVGGCLSANIK